MEIWNIALLVLLLVVGVVGGALVARSRRRELPPAPPAQAARIEAPSDGRPERAAERPEAGEVEEPAAGAAPPEPPAPEPTSEPALPAAPPAPSAEEKAGIFARLKAGLAKTHKQLVERLDEVFSSRKQIDEELFEELEMVLLTADVGVKTTSRLLEELRKRASRDQLKDPSALRGELQAGIAAILSRQDSAMADMEGKSPYVIMIVGVNGVGKTTTIGKLASLYTRQGKKVVLAAGDTFRAAAIQQLEVWGERAGAPVVKKGEGADPSSVVFEALDVGRREGADVVIADTAGRLHTKIDLMDELKKVHRVIGKALPGAPHEVLLVLDSTTGQNAVTQARAFNEGCPLTGLVLTKLDGTAKGGVIISICDELGVPVKFIGIGEKVDDLRPFVPEDFVKALF